MAPTVPGPAPTRPSPNFRGLHRGWTAVAGPGAGGRRRCSQIVSARRASSFAAQSSASAPLMVPSGSVAAISAWRACARSPVGAVAEHPAHGARHHGRRGPSRVQIQAGARPLHAGRHLGLVLAVARDDEGNAVGQRLLHAAVAPVGHHDVDVGEQEIVRDEALQAHVRRQAPPEGLGIGPARGGDDEHVIAGQGPGRDQHEPAQVRVVQGALGDVDDRATAPELVPPGRFLEGLRRRVQDGPDEAHRGGEVRARVFEARHRLLQKGVDHLGLEVDEVAGEAGRAGFGQSASGEALNVRQQRSARWPSSWWRCGAGAAVPTRAGTPRRTGRCPGCWTRRA